MTSLCSDTCRRKRLNRLVLDSPWLQSYPVRLAAKRAAGKPRGRAREPSPPNGKRGRTPCRLGQQHVRSRARRPFPTPLTPLRGSRGRTVNSMPCGGTTSPRGSTRSWWRSGPTHARCFLDSFELRTGGSEMDTRDRAVSVVGYLLFVALAVALIAGVMASF